jgi:hypothetical protein
MPSDLLRLEQPRADHVSPHQIASTNDFRANQ